MNPIVSLPEAAFSFARENYGEAKFHAHFTFATNASLLLLDNIARDMGNGKLTRIWLRDKTGKSGTDNMVTIHLAAADVFSAALKLDSLMSMLGAMKVYPSRVKLEAKLSDVKGKNFSFWHYGESHAVVSCKCPESDIVLPEVEEFIKKYYPTWAAFSGNLDKEFRSEKIRQLYLTQRRHSGKISELRKTFESMAFDIENKFRGIMPMSLSEEVIVFDNNRNHDNWWA